MASKRRNGEDVGSGEAVRVEVRVFFSAGVAQLTAELTWRFFFLQVLGVDEERASRRGWETR